MKSILLKISLLLVWSVGTFTFPLLGQELSEELEMEASVIEGMLIAPCCWRQPVSVHYSPAADQVRSKIREMLAAGLAREEVLAHFVEEHGDQIMAKPPASGFNLLAYFLPVGFLVIGAAVAFAVLKKLRPRGTRIEGPKTKPSKIDAKDSDRIEKELWG